MLDSMLKHIEGYGMSDHERQSLLHLEMPSKLQGPVACIGMALSEEAGRGVVVGTWPARSLVLGEARR